MLLIQVMIQFCSWFIIFICSTAAYNWEYIFLRNLFRQEELVFIRRFRVRIPGRFQVTCWPNGKASDYGLFTKLFFLFCGTGAFCYYGWLIVQEFHQWIFILYIVANRCRVVLFSNPSFHWNMTSMSYSRSNQNHFVFVKITETPIKMSCIILKNWFLTIWVIEI